MILRLLVVLSIAHVCAFETVAAGDTLTRGMWHLNPGASQNLIDETKNLNNRLNAQRREREYEKDPRQKKSSSRNRFQATADAVENMIREDSRSIDWAISDDIEMIATCESIKLYQGGKVVVLYGSDLRRLLRLNPQGRAFSVSGQEITKDDVGRSLTFYEDGALVIETKPFDGGRLVERYSVDAESNQLTQSLEILEREGGPKLSFSRVFDPVE